MFWNIGSVNNYLKGMQLEHKWNEKKKNGQIVGTSYLDTIRQMQEKNDQFTMASITTKLNSGKKLSASEMEYLRKNNPSLYKEAVEIAKEREEYEAKLRSCKTKQEVDRVHAGAMSGLLKGTQGGSASPGGGSGNSIMRLASITNARSCFVQSSEYDDLPNDYDKEEEKRKTKPKTQKPVTLYRPAIYWEQALNQAGEVPRTEAAEAAESAPESEKDSQADTTANAIYNQDGARVDIPRPKGSGGKTTAGDLSGIEIDA